MWLFMVFNVLCGVKKTRQNAQVTLDQLSFQALVALLVAKLQYAQRLAIIEMAVAQDVQRINRSEAGVADGLTVLANLHAVRFAVILAVALKVERKHILIQRFLQKHS